ncbi:toxin-antitoxin system YwqK family antitoxin [Deferrisoma camini]|uniref:toxin-antitoxin system YwqK family antitoxin n=1 Tax=Deferrisoma camini TaxID=1035120 RepID=UPI0004B2520C|nr:toxin-antitoxin system YwqK family antitoxin [Deferrisoma camini]
MTRRTVGSLLLLLSGLVWTASCGGGGGGGGATGAPSGQDDAFRPVASAEIGAGGGEVSDEGVTVQVPENAWADEATVVLSRSDDGAPFGEGTGATALYRIDGFPAERDERPRIVWRPQGVAPGTEMAVALGRNAYARSLDDEVLGYRLLACVVDDDGVCSVELPAAPPAAGRTGRAAPDVGETASWFFQGLWGTVTHDTAHFAIAYVPAASPWSESQTQAYVEALGGYLEDAYGAYEAAGFDYSPRTEWPVAVTVKPLQDTVFGYSVSGDDNDLYLEFNAKKLDDASNVRATVFHEFLHLVQELYVPGSGASDTLWLDEACAVWAEGRFAGGAGYVSTVREGNEHEPFQGIGRETSQGDKTAQAYGYGMAAAVGYLADEHGDSVVVGMYERIRDGATAIQSFLAAAEDPVEAWWPEFVERYATGRLSPDVTPQVLSALAGSAQTMRLARSTPSAELTASSPDLSAQVFKVLLTDPGVGVGAVLAAELKGDLAGFPLRALRYRYRPDAEVELVAEGAGSVAVPDVAELALDGWHLLFVAVDPACEGDGCGGTRTAELDLSLTTAVSERAPPCPASGPLWEGWPLPEECDTTLYPLDDLREEICYEDADDDGVCDEGYQCIYFNTGALDREIVIRDEARNGYVKSYSGDGSLYGALHYTNGTVDGKKRTFYPNLYYRDVIDYVDGVAEGDAWSCYDSGSAAAAYHLVSGAYDGVFATYYEDGTLASVAFFSDGKREGLTTSYHENGVVSQVAPYADGVLDGKVIEYDTNGRQISCTVYEQGTEVGPCDE